MTSEDRFHELVDRWEEAYERGEFIRIEQLCVEDPELLEPVREQIKALKWVPSFAEDETDSSHLVSFSTRDSSGREIQHAPVPRKLGRYDLVEPLGAGGFGQVWRAHDPELERSVAIKIPQPNRISADEEEIDRFLDEARRVARLRHAGIVTVFDVGREGKWCYFVSEWVDGEPLSDRVQNGPIAWEEAVRITSDVAEELHYAHDQGIIHRDVKPSNILLRADGRVFLTDFGIAISKTQLEAEQGTMSGTLAYMSPEQAKGDARAIDRSSDVYSLGIVLYQMITGCLPLESRNPAKLRQMIQNVEPLPARRRNPSLPRILDHACMRALSKDQGQRYETAAEFSDQLQSTLAVRSRVRNYQLATVAVSIIAIVALSVVYALERPPEESDVGSGAASDDTSKSTGEKAPEDRLSQGGDGKSAADGRQTPVGGTVELPFVGVKGQNRFHSVFHGEGLLVGVRMTTGRHGPGYKYKAVASVQGIYRNSQGQIFEGKTDGRVKSDLKEFVAEDGYAVGGIKVTLGGLEPRPEGHHVKGIQLVYMRRDGDRLDPEDLKYSKPYLASISGAKLIGGDGRPIIGLHGYWAKQELRGLGVIQAPPDE